jgi:DNA end-binding protein Ku
MAGRGHSLWSGTLTFGLVSVPVAVVPAVHSRRKAFHLLHEPDASRLERRMFCPSEEVFVHPEHIQRGYEVEQGKYVVIEDAEIQSIAPKRSKTIEIQQFVQRSRIDPAYYERPYYLVPTGAEKPYRLLVETLAQLDRAGLSEFVMHAREHFCAIQSIGGALCLMKLRYPDELRNGQEVAARAEAEASDVRSIKDAISKSKIAFDPVDLTDEYRRRVDKLIRKKKEEGTVEGPDSQEGDEASQAGQGPAEGEGKQTDLVSALEASLAKEKEKGS